MKNTQFFLKTNKKLLSLPHPQNTDKLFSPIERRNMRPLNRCNLGGNLSRRKKRKTKSQKNGCHEKLELYSNFYKDFQNFVSSRAEHKNNEKLKKKQQKKQWIFTITNSTMLIICNREE